MDGSSVRVAVNYGTACTSNAPSVTLQPTVLAAATAPSFSLTVRNNDELCSGTMFTPSVMGITGTFTPQNAILQSAQTQTFTLTASGMVDGLTPFTVTVRDTDGTDPTHVDVSVQGSVVVDATPPSTPTGLTAIAGKQGAVDLQWDVATDNVGVTGYDVLRNGILIRTVAALTFTEKPGTGTFTYTVRARDAANNVSPDSSPATITTTTRGKPVKTR